MQTILYIPTNPFPLRKTFSSFPKWLASPLSTQFADIYDVPLLIIKEDHLGERNSSLSLQPVQDRVGVTTLVLSPSSLPGLVSLLHHLSLRTSQSA